MPSKAQFRELQLSIRQWVDTLPRDGVRSATILARIFDVPSMLGLALHTWVLLVFARYQPIAQMCVRVSPISEDAHVNELGFVELLPGVEVGALGVGLKILPAPPRACALSAVVGSVTSFAF